MYTVDSLYVFHHFVILSELGSLNVLISFVCLYSETCLTDHVLSNTVMPNTHAWHMHLMLPLPLAHILIVPLPISVCSLRMFHVVAVLW